jgi:hypothetical protein
MKRYETCKQRRKICSQRTQNLDPKSEEETEKQGEHEGRDRLAFQTELLYQRCLKREISGEEASRLFMQRRISNRDEAIRKMEIICEIRKSELKSLSSKQEKRETIESIQRLQQMIETQKRNRTSSTE